MKNTELGILPELFQEMVRRLKDLPNRQLVKLVKFLIYFSFRHRFKLF